MDTLARPVAIVRSILPGKHLVSHHKYPVNHRFLVDGLSQEEELPFYLLFAVMYFVKCFYSFIFSLFVPDTNNFFFPSFFPQLVYTYLNFINILKEPAFGFVGFSPLASHNFIDFFSNFYYLSSRA